MSFLILMPRHADESTLSGFDVWIAENEVIQCMRLNHGRSRLSIQTQTCQRNKQEIEMWNEMWLSILLRLFIIIIMCGCGCEDFWAIFLWSFYEMLCVDKVGQPYLKFSWFYSLIRNWKKFWWFQNFFFGILTQNWRNWMKI